MGKPVAIITDSTTYIPDELMKDFNIHISPAIVIWEGDELRDGVDISPEEFYTRLETAKEMPTTSQPSPGDMHTLYKKLVEDGYDILVYTVSDKLSGTLDSAKRAKEMLPSANIEVLDSYSVSMGAGWPILEAAKAAKDGASLADCKEIAIAARANTDVIVMVDTLEFLHRGGRIGGAARFIGTALNFKPILEIRDGRLEPLERVRTRKKAVDRLVDLAVERIGGRGPVRLAVVNANVPEAGQELLEKANAAINPIESVITPLSPGVGTHTGPGTLALAYMIDHKS